MCESNSKYWLLFVFQSFFSLAFCQSLQTFYLLDYYKMIRNIIIPSYPYSNQNADTLSPEVQKKVLDAFEVFDHEQNKTVDAREIGTIIRSLGKYV